MAVMKVETDFIVSISESPVGRAVIMNVKTFKTDVIGFFIGNAIRCLTSHFC